MTIKTVLRQTECNFWELGQPVSSHFDQVQPSAGQDSSLFRLEELLLALEAGVLGEKSCSNTGHVD